MKQATMNEEITNESPCSGCGDQRENLRIELCVTCCHDIGMTADEVEATL